MDFSASLTTLFTEQKQRLEKATNDNAFIKKVFEELIARNLDPDSINKDCAQELKLVLSKTYDQPIVSSRLGGLGWTSAHIADHMKRFLQAKIGAAGSYIREQINSFFEKEGHTSTTLQYDLNELEL